LRRGLTSFCKQWADRRGEFRLGQNFVTSESHGITSNEPVTVTRKRWARCATGSRLLTEDDSNGHLSRVKVSGGREGQRVGTIEHLGI